MHIPSSEPRASVFYKYHVHPFRHTPDMDSGRASAPVVIVGAGPIGLEIYRMVMPHDEDDRFMPGLNIQQQYIEEYLIDFCRVNPLIDLRWGEKVVGISQRVDAVRLRIDTPENEYDLEADWVVAADGGRSSLRKFLGLRMVGRSYPGNFVIADIKAQSICPPSVCAISIRRGIPATTSSSIDSRTTCGASISDSRTASHPSRRSNLLP